MELLHASQLELKSSRDQVTAPRGVEALISGEILILRLKNTAGRINTYEMQLNINVW